MDPTNFSQEEIARHVAEQRRLMQEADALMRYAHSRTGLLARLDPRGTDGAGRSRRDRHRRGAEAPRNQL